MRTLIRSLLPFINSFITRHSPLPLLPVDTQRWFWFEDLRVTKESSRLRPPSLSKLGPSPCFSPYSPFNTYCSCLPGDKLLLTPQAETVLLSSAHSMDLSFSLYATPSVESPSPSWDLALFTEFLTQSRCLIDDLLSEWTSKWENVSIYICWLLFKVHF